MKREVSDTAVALTCAVPIVTLLIAIGLRKFAEFAPQLGVPQRRLQALSESKLDWVIHLSVGSMFCGAILAAFANNGPPALFVGLAAGLVAFVAAMVMSRPPEFAPGPDLRPRAIAGGLSLTFHIALGAVLAIIYQVTAPPLY